MALELIPPEGLAPLVQQTKALIQKNILLLRRRWISTLLAAYIFPVLILALLVNLNRIGNAQTGYGVGSPAPLKDFRSVLPTDKQFVVVSNSSMGPDVDRVIKNLVEPLGGFSDRIVKLNSEDDLTKQCVVNRRGYSPCHAAVVFEDSPLTSGGRGNWTYTMRTDPGKQSAGRVNVFAHDSTFETLWLPMQFAIENAITNATDVRLSAYTYTSTTAAQMEKYRRADFAYTFSTIFIIIYFISYMPIIFHAVTTITAERELGIAQLIDAMGGKPVARVVGFVVPLNILYLPTWIVFGSLYWYSLFKASNAAIPIFWSIFTGMAITNASIFGAAFFSGRSISGIVVTVSFVSLAAIAADSLPKSTLTTGAAVLCSLLFPAMNFIYALSRMSRFAFLDSPVDMSSAAYLEQAQELNQRYLVASWVFWFLLFIQILGYPILAVFAEHLMHGLSSTRRSLSSTPETEASSVAVETTSLRKEYAPSLLRRFFCCGRRSETVIAVDGLDLIARKSQILCLLGVNGSGKTTTLELIGGNQRSTAGHVQINAASTKLGICPQKNLLWPKLTVFEHVKHWSGIKGGHESPEEILQLIEACDLTSKIHSRSATLSGGQKRKLQLACMFVGGSTVCLMDEVTTGLDPVSRRVIWNIILAERSKRSMIFTTHFLDEGEVLADHIVLLSRGQIKAQGSGAEMKNRFGGGYRVVVPKTGTLLDLNVPCTTHQDQVIYHTEDSKSAAELITELEAAGQKDIAMQGPTIEDVFLNLTQDVDDAAKTDLGTTKFMSTELSDMSNLLEGDKQQRSGVILNPGKPTSVLYQILVLFRKRFTILPRFWLAPLIALVLPSVIPSQIYGAVFSETFKRPTCDQVIDGGTFSNRVSLTNSFNFRGSHTFMPIGPPTVRDTLVKVASTFPIGQSFNMSSFDDQFSFQPDLKSFMQTISDQSVLVDYGGVFMGDDKNPPTIAYNTQYGVFGVTQMMNLFSSLRSQVKIDAGVGSFSTLNSSGDGNGSLAWVLIVLFLFVVYPSFFALYPAYEKSHNIRALQYAHGVRPFPLWMSHLLFDLITVFLISIALTVSVALIFPESTLAPANLFPVSLLYGVAMMVMNYIISRSCRSQLTAFTAAFGINILMYIITMVTFLLPRIFIDAEKLEGATDLIAFILGLFMPTMNLLKALAVCFNTSKICCRESGMVTNPISMYAYGGPVLLLVIQVIAFILILVWLESSHSFQSLRQLLRRNEPAPEAEDGVSGTASAIAKEAARVQVSGSEDLLCLSHVTKRFGDNVAVDDVSLGVGRNEILALLGPNGAGKTTLANMITGQLSPDTGRIQVSGVEVRTSTQHTSLGVCPQVDALDLMTARQHVELYARLRGAPQSNVQAVLDRLGLAPHADKLASRLSGGNKRKTSLAVALVGNPDVLVLDEPSSAMDAAAKRAMWRLLAAVVPGRSVLLTTHSMEEADALATRVAILSKRLLALGTTRTLRERYSNVYHVELVLRSAPESSPEEMRDVEQWVRQRFEGVAFSGESLGGQVKFFIPNTTTSSEGRQGAVGGRKQRSAIGRLIETLEAHKEELGLADYSIGAPTLERVFLSVMKESNVSEEDYIKKKRRWLFGL